MTIFQTSSFIGEIIFYLFLGGLFAFSPEIFLGEKFRSIKKLRYSYLEITSVREMAAKRQISLWKIIWTIIVMSVTIYLLKPYLLDVPQLITWKLNYITGEVINIRTESKDPIQYVDINGGGEVRFFFSSGVSNYKDYKIGYLTHTWRAIYCEQIDESNGNKKTIGFPFKDILMYLTIVGIIFLIIFVSPYVRLKLFIPINIISIPGFTYFFIKHGIDSSIWFSLKNNGFFSLIFGLFSLFMILFFYFIEKRKSREVYVAFFFAQLFSICDIGLLVCLIFNLK